MGQCFGLQLFRARHGDCGEFPPGRYGRRDAYRNSRQVGCMKAVLRRAVVTLSLGVIVATGAQASDAADPPPPWLELTNTHTGEVARVSFKSGGEYDGAALTQLQHVLRDHRR